MRFRAGSAPTAVDEYWNRHTVNSTPFTSAEESERYLEWRCEQYPLFREFMEIYGEHDDEIILDYGCGPGNDLVGFLLYTRARKLIGVDVSMKALELSRARMGLHGVDPGRVELIHKMDSSPSIPLADDSIDYINCGGVLQITSDPAGILREFHRVLKGGSRAMIMVYNRDSLWYHLYTAYVKMIVEGAFAGMSIHEAFARNTDGDDCPISRSYASDEFSGMARTAGFEPTYLGGYLCWYELKLWKDYGALALDDSRLADEHKEFLRRLVWDAQGYPAYHGKHAGIGGVYRLDKL